MDRSHFQKFELWTFAVAARPPPGEPAHTPLAEPGEDIVNSIKLAAGQVLPDITAAKLGGGEIRLATPAESCKWRVIVVYRGKHCPICTNYLVRLNELLPEFNKIGVDVVAVSADSVEKAQAHIGEISPDFEVGYGLSVEQMRKLGLYISNPRSAASEIHLPQMKQTLSP